MAWGIVSNPSHNPKFQVLKWHLFLSYLTVMLTILLVSAVVVFAFFRRSLHEQLDQRLTILAQAAPHDLLAIKEYNSKNKHNSRPKLSSQFSPSYCLDKDVDLDIPWHNLRIPDQGIEWFSANGKLLGKAGTLVPGFPPKPGSHTYQHGQIRTLTIAAYGSSHGEQYLKGYIRSSESTRSVEATLNHLCWGLGWGGSVVLGLTGLSGLWLTQRSLKPIRQSLEQLKQFTADASHELRSPLTTIKTSVEVMQHYPERIHPQDFKKLRAITTSANRMAHLVDDLLLLARINELTAEGEQGFKWVSLDQILEELLDLLELQAQEQGVALKSDLLKGVRVKGDATQLRRLFANLLDNALQYTLPGGTVTLAMRRNYHTALVFVKDTGIGIEPDQLGFVFDRFWRADKARSRRAGGSGLGLAIAQVIVQRHGGEITVTSQVGVGSCFEVHLPLA